MSVELTARGDSQNHADYAQRLFGWDLTSQTVHERIDPLSVWDRQSTRRDYMHIRRCVITSHEVMLDDLLTRKIETGDVLSGANTIILMGKTRQGNKIGRALQIAKHRGSYCDESIVPFQVSDQGLTLTSQAN